MDLSKAFDTLNHELLIAKLHAYGLDNSALKLIFSYISNRWQRTKVNKSFSSWFKLLSGVPQGSILGPLLFNIYLNDLFFLVNDCDICNFADDATPFACDMDINVLMTRLEFCTAQLLEWFEVNYMKLNASKCHFLVCGNKQESLTIKVGNSFIKESLAEILLGINIDNTLSFSPYLNDLCKKAGKKLNALSRMCKFLSLPKRRQCVKAYFESQFSYAPLVSMCHSRELNSKINTLHFRALKIVYQDYESTFEALLEKDGSLKIHHRNIHTLATEMFKRKNNLSPEFMRDVFQMRPNEDAVSRNTRSGSSFYNFHNPRTTTFGLQSISCLGPKIWEILPKEIQLSPSLSQFKNSISS